jgi:16S rRNA (guanine527-N7)-methyltransferase
LTSTAGPSAADNPLGDDATALGLALTPEAVHRLTAFVALLAKWNQTYNLTAVRDTAAMHTQHIADCLAVVPSLRRMLSDRRDPALLDVGSGGGLPGIVLAAAEPSWRITCVDAVAKKAAFITQAAAELGLTNLQSRHSRVEQLREGAFDVIISRAFASLDAFSRLTQPLLSRDGVWVAMKGHVPHAELAELPSAIEVFHVEPLTVPRLDAERCLIWMRRR